MANPGDETLTITRIEQSTNGTASLSTGGGSIIYRPNLNYFSPEGTPDVFYYTVQDSANHSVRFSVSVNVIAVNDAPILTVATETGEFADVSLSEDTVSSAIRFTVSDVEDAASKLEVTVSHDNGVLLPVISVTKDANGVCSFVIDSNDNKVGTATITVRVTDSGSLSVEKSFSLVVEKSNDAPDAQNDVETVSEAGTVTISVLNNDDVDILTGNGGDELTLLSIGTEAYGWPQFGTAQIVNNEILYTHTAETTDKANYTDVFGYTMRDKSGQTSSAKVTVTITPFNDPPAITDVQDVTNLQEDAVNGTGELSFYVTDEEDDDDGLVVSASSSNPQLVPVTAINIQTRMRRPMKPRHVRTVKVVPAENQFARGYYVDRSRHRR
jgi:hypothetical protein